MASTDPDNAKWKTVGVVEVSNEGAKGSGGRIQQRVETPNTPAKEERIRAAQAQFAVARGYIVAHAALFPEACYIEVTARGDDIDRPGSVEVQINIFE